MYWIPGSGMVSTDILSPNTYWNIPYYVFSCWSVNTLWRNFQMAQVWMNYIYLIAHIFQNVCLHICLFYLSVYTIYLFYVSVCTIYRSIYTICLFYMSVYKNLTVLPVCLHIWLTYLMVLPVCLHIWLLPVYTIWLFYLSCLHNWLFYLSVYIFDCSTCMSTHLTVLPVCLHLTILSVCLHNLSVSKWKKTDPCCS